MTLQLYILRQLAVSIGFAAAGIGLFVLPTTLIQAIHKLDGVGLLVVFTYLPMVLVELVAYLLPMAFLLAVVATYGRLAADRELVAIKMAGIHPSRLTWPALLIAVVLSGWTWHLLSNVSPEWKFKSRNFLHYHVVESFKNFRGQTELRFGRSSLSAERASGKVFEGVLLNLAESPEDEVVTVLAERALLDVEVEPDPETGEPREVLVIVLEEMELMGDDTLVRNVKPEFRLPLDEVFQIKPKSQDEPKYLRSGEMQRRLANGDVRPELIGLFEYEIERRKALSWIYFVFLLLGVPTGILLRSGTQLSAFTGAVGYALLYYVLAMQLGKALAETGSVPPLVAAWSTNVLFLVAGAVLFHRAVWR